MVQNAGLLMKVSMFMMADALSEVCVPGNLNAASKRVCIEAVMPYEGGGFTEENVLYVLEGKSELAVSPPTEGCRYLLLTGPVPPTVARGPFQYLVANEGVNLMSLLSAALRAQRWFESWQDRLTDELLRRRDLDEICALGSEMLGQPVMIFDKSYSVIGNSLPLDQVVDSSFFVKCSSHYTINPEAMRALVEQLDFQATFQKKGAHFFGGGGTLKRSPDHASLYVNIGRGTSYAGRIVIPYSTGCPRAGDYQVAELLCDAVREAMRAPSLQGDELDRVFRTYFLSMLEGRVSDDRQLADSLRLWGWPRKGRFVCFRAKLAEDAKTAETDAFLRFQLEMELPGSCAVRHLDGISCVVLLGNDMDYEQACQTFCRVLHGMNEAVGISQEYDDALLTSEYYTEASIAAEICVRLGLSECRFADIALRHYHECGCSRLSAMHFCDVNVKSLLSYRGQRRDYYHILKTYLEHNMNLLRTSEALFVHRTTLFNYLKELNNAIDVDLDDTNSRLRMLSSFEILSRDEL